MAERCKFLAQILSKELKHLDVKVLTNNKNHFDTIVLSARDSGFTSSDYVLAEFHKYGINLRKVDEDLVGISFNETSSIIDLEELLEVFAEMKGRITNHEKPGYLSPNFYEQ